MAEEPQLMHAPHRHRTIHDYLRILVRRRWVILFVSIFILSIVALNTFTATPIYKATVQIMIERQTPNYLPQPGGSTQYDYYGDDFYQTQYKLLASPALAKKVVAKLNLKDNPRFAPILRGLAGNADATMKQRAEESLIGAIAGGVGVSPVKQSRLVNVSFYDPDPKFAATVANTLAQCFIEQSLELRFTASQEVAAWLREKLIEGRKKLEESEANLNKYKREHNIVALDDKESITAQKLEQLNKDLIVAQTRQMEAESRFKEANQGKPISQILDNPLIQILKGQEAKLIAEQSDLSQKYGVEHPRMIRLANEIAATRAKIAAEKGQVVQAIKNDYAMAKEQAEHLRAALEAQKADTQDLGDRNIKYRVLLRDVETNRALYENMLKSLKTTTVTENTPVTNIRIVYPATIPNTPVSPRKARNLLLASVFGIVFGIAVALGLENLNTTLKTPEESEEWLEIPNLALIPHMESTSGNPEKEELLELAVHDDNQPLATEAYRKLRTTIQFSSPGKAPRILLITSSLPLEGKSLTSVNLANTMAIAQPNVLLVDADLRRPSLHKIFHLPQEPGLCNFLVGEVDDLPVAKTVVPNLFVVTSGKIPPNPSELLGSERMQEFLDLTKGQFGCIILDSPPLMSVTDAVILATKVEGVIMVVKAEFVPRRAAMEAKAHLLDVNAPLLGTVFNNIPIKRNSYLYNYSYSYRYHSYYTAGGQHESARSGSRNKLVPAGIIARLKQRLTAKQSGAASKR
jgi:succinoglycan biosynthesis transport protein ExoP